MTSIFTRRASPSQEEHHLHKKSITFTRRASPSQEEHKPPQEEHTLYIVHKILDLLLPRRCVVCEETLNPHEQCLCTSCLLSLPRTEFEKPDDNEVVRHFWHVAPVRFGASLMRYNPNTDHHRIIEAMKYKARPDVCRQMGKMLASTLAEKGIPDGIDAIVPIPLSRKRLKERGYNQAAHIAHGISLATGLPVSTSVLFRKVDNPSQTHLSLAERQENVKGIFGVKNAHLLQGAHILIVDDIITTGSTISAAIQVLMAHIPQLTISVASIGLTEN